MKTKESEKMLNELRDLLKRQDWYYEYCDDFRIWSRHQENMAKINALFKDISEAGYRPEAILLWDEFAPNERKINKS